MFQDLGPDARELLGVIAFFPQGVDEKNLGWLFPTVLNRASIFGKFCILSLTYRSNRFTTMLAPLRDYLSPKDPKSSLLPCAAKDHYFTQMSVNINPDKPEYGESRWIVSEDANVEHLLDIFTTIDANSDSVWKACADFMRHLAWHKKRLVILEPKIHRLPDDHWFKPECLFELSRLFYSVGNQAERKLLLLHALSLWRRRGSGRQIVWTLRELSDASRKMGLHTRGIRQAKEALEIHKRLCDIEEHARCLKYLAFILHDDNQLDAAEKIAYCAINLIPKKGSQSLVCESHRLLGNIYQSKGDTVKAVHNLEVALRIASSFNWHDHLFWIHYDLAQLFLDKGRFADAHAHIERAKSHAVNSAYNLGLAMELRAQVWYKQQRLEEARSEGLRAADLYEKLGAVKDAGDCRRLLQRIGGKS